MSKELSHIGMPRRSGRYPWGSGEDPQQRNKSFLGQVEELKKKGLSGAQIAEGLGMTTTQLRARISIANSEIRKSNVSQALRLKDKGYSNVAIGERMGVNESTVRSWLNPALQERSEMTKATANMLKESIEKKGYIDVGAGAERYINVSRTKLKTSIEMLKDEGYMVTYIPVEQLGTGKKTNVMVLSKPKNSEAREILKLKNQGLDEVEISRELKMDRATITSRLKEAYADVYANKNNVRMITDQYSNDGGRTFLGLEPIKNVSLKRIDVRYHEDGGSDKDGVIELRRGVKDLDLGNSKYAQVRIGVDGTHYLKGMAMYSDDIPEGVDIIFNTNKKINIDKLSALKVMAPDMSDPKAKSIQRLKISDAEKEELLKRGVADGSIKPDPDNPFGATIKAGGQRGALNIVNEEGDWGKWSKSLSSQVISKQTSALAQKQLGLAFDIKKEEFDEIVSLTNPAVKKRLLDAFADDCDSAAVHLKAAALPRQGSHVILPFPNMKETEIYAPNYRDGENVVLIRYPHGGRFEIPELTVNNRNRDANKTIKGAIDAVGIHPKVAERLSGADFDGDTVLVIPNTNKSIKTSPALKGLVDFDPKALYKRDHPTISPRTKQMKMGDVSNLITDMTIKGAVDDELARAVRHSMVVIDAEKHNLDYKQSYIDNGIASLKKRYQGSERSGASTLISKASSEKRVPDRVEGKKIIDPVTGKSKRLYVDPNTGKKLYEETGETYVKRTKLKDGTVKETVLPRTVSSTKMAEVDDAFTLSSGTPMETVYASHANKLKALANEARKTSMKTEPLVYSSSAKQTYAKEVDSLRSSLNLALKNAPLERQAQILANSIVAMKKNDNPSMDADDLKKVKSQALAEARTRTGAKKHQIEISDREWEAIQAGAVSNNVLTQILNNTDLDKIKQLATPRTSSGLTPAKESRAKQLRSKGYTQAEIAQQLGVSTTTINKLLD